MPESITCSSKEVTQLLVKVQAGDQNALNVLVPLVYGELRKLASNYLRQEHRNQTIHTTDLVHEVFLRLIGQENVTWENRSHFFGIAANVMRQVLVDYARKRSSVKRGGKMTRVSLGEAALLAENSFEQILVVDEALGQLQDVDQRMSKIVELRFFSGLTIEEIAEVLSVSPRTVKRDWALARAWLHRKVSYLH